MNFIQQYIAARRVSTPLIAIQTSDSAATIVTISKLEKATYPVFSWDCVRGFIPVSNTKQAVEALSNICGPQPPNTWTNPSEALSLAAKFPEDSVLFIHNTPLLLVDNDLTPSIIQGIWNLRDIYKSTGRVLILLGVEFKLPPELQDVLILDEPLPDIQRLQEVFKECFKAAEFPEPSVELITKCSEALSGLSEFTAEQAVMMSLDPTLELKIDVEGLWERKRKVIDQTAGLSVWRGKETFNDIGGVASIKTFLLRLLKGKQSPNVVLFWDEIEKSVAGSSGGDLSGTKQDLVGTILSWMEDYQVVGMIFIGPPGCAKSAIGKAIGNEGELPTISLDFAGMEQSLVGESGRNLRQALKIINAVSNKRVLCIATCNKIAELPPELRRRFGFGTFFFDLPETAEERDKIWSIYKQKWQLTYPTPPDVGWTGAEIKQCCLLANTLNCSLEEAAGYVVPVSVSAPEMIARLQEQADGKFLSAAHPGVYKINKQVAPTRKVNFRADLN